MNQNHISSDYNKDISTSTASPSLKQVPY